MSEFPGSFSYPPFISVYAGIAAGPLDERDTISHFHLTVDAAIYTLPGLPRDNLTTPNAKRLEVTASAGGKVSALVGPPDYAQLPVPSLGDFRGVILQSVGDFALVEWLDSRWKLVEVGGPTAAVATVQQNVI